MSHSPASATQHEQLQAYRTGWRATMQLLNEGRSFSGNEPNCAMLNTTATMFANVGSVTGLDYSDDGRAIALVDWDQDGDLDLWYANRTGPRLRFMKNQWMDSVSIDSGSASYLAIELEGTRSNRDAIGARVEVVLAPNSESPPNPVRRLMQSLRAGEGYLSQSSKTLHFGIEPNARIDHVLVTWPSGETQRIEGLEPGARYHVLEGTAGAASRPPRAMPVELAAALQPEPEQDTARRTLLGTRIPIPLLRYAPAADQQPVVLAAGTRPLILTLWASWCPNCLAELADLQAHTDALRAAGAEVLALNVDRLDASHELDVDHVDDRLRQLQFTHATGYATLEALDKLDLLKSLIFSRKPASAVPATYLIDRDGKLAAIYQGRVAMSQLLADLGALELPAQDWRDRVVPLAGRWSQPPRELLTAAIARYFRDAGYREDYAHYLERDTQELSQRIAAARSDQSRDVGLQHYAQAHFNLGVEFLSSGDLASAAESFASATRAQPNHHDAQLNLGTLLARQGKIDLAIERFQQALAANASSIPAHTNLAASWEAKGDFARAVELYRAFVRLAPTQHEHRARFGRALVETGRFSEAVEQFVLAVQTDPDDLRSLLCLAWLHATAPDDALRDGVKAESYARRVAELRGLRDPIALDLLSAAAAAQGDFATALAHVRTALERTATSSSPVKETLRAHEAAYLQGISIRDADGKYP